MTDLFADLSAALGGTYRLERELGGGGMSRVFLAEETALGRKVVIKVLPPDMAASVNQDRFRREMQVVARLQHPHVVPLLNAGLAGELLWYSMPFVEGESLRARIARSGELPVAEAARLLREVAEALEHAHTHGVVHRDIKPDNVLLSDGHAVVTDFGVAKAVSESGGAGGLTSVGLALGTPSYMAPEQATADPQTDERADIYALGAMGYEMLTGEPPFTGPNPQAVLAGHLTKTPTPVSGVRPAVPAVLNAVVMRCLEKRPADRFQRARDLIPHLDAYLTPSGGTATVTAAVATQAEPEATPHPVRVAILFALGSLVVLSLVYWLTQRLGLPGWVLPVAVILLLIGLPIVVWATMQERQRAFARVTGEHPVVPSGPLGQLTTLRGALRGGAFAFAGLLVGAAAFMGLRAAGIGPFATLVSAGVLGARDRMVLADFSNRTSDSTLGSSITEALRIDLSRSNVVRLLEAEEVRAALQRMERQAEPAFTQALAVEVAQREGAKAVVAGEIAPLGAGYVLTASVLNVADKSTLIAERETATDAGGLIGAVDKLSRKLRERIGESLRTIRAGEPLVQVTTSSLEALRLYTQAEAAADRGADVEAARMLHEALALDSTFAMAWRKLAVVVGNQGLNRALEVAATVKAYELRERLPERERLLATAYYFDTGLNDRDQAILAYRQVLQRFPDDGTALNNIAVALVDRGRYEEAEQATRAGVEVSPNTGVLWNNLIGSQVSQGRFAAAESTLARWAEFAPNVFTRQNAAVFVAYLQGDFATATAHSDTLALSDDPSWKSPARAQLGLIASAQGHLREAQRRFREAVDLRLASGDVYAHYLPLERLLQVEIELRGRPQVAVQTLDSTVAARPLDSLPPYNRPYLMLASLYAKAGNPDRAERLYQEWERAVNATEQQATDEAPGTRGLIALARGRFAEAIAQFRASKDRVACAPCFMYETGQAFEGLNQPDSALAAYESAANAINRRLQLQRVSLAPTYLRLGELYEAKADRTKALDYYGRFVDLWKDADPELQPRVADVRKRIAELTAKER